MKERVEGKTERMGRLYVVAKGYAPYTATLNLPMIYFHE